MNFLGFSIQCQIIPRIIFWPCLLINLIELFVSLEFERLGKHRASIGQQYLGDSLYLLGNCYGEFMEKIGLKDPGYYSASFWSYNFSILLCERPKSKMSMISGFLDP